MLRWLFFSLPLVLAQEGTVFSIRFEISADPNAATPQEYFNAMQEAFADAAASDTVGAGGTGGTGIDGASIGGTTGSQIGSQLTLSHFDEGSLLAQVSFTEAVVSRTMKVCDMEPFWEKGQTVYDLRNCRLSPVKMIIWALVPSITLSCGLLGLWSRQRNVRGRGKETKIGSLIACGVSFLSVGYDWFFSWTLYRNPVGNFQQGVYEVGLVCLAIGIVINFLTIHFWFRRKFLVSMPWYEYHKHGLGLHFIFLLMYVNPQACSLFTSRLFDVDLFNIHFGTPSKMNEVLSNVGCLSLLSDVPLLLLKSWVYFLDTNGLQAPKVTRVSMGITAIHLTLVIKRQYVASVERSWYQEIVRMAGVRRLTTYGGASRWLKFQKRPSAAADLQGAASSQQQLFLAWMQSMGRRQESIFQDAASKPQKEEADDEISDDSEDDLDSGSDSSDGKATATPAGDARARRSRSKLAEEDEDPGSASESEESGKLELQSHRAASRVAREERPLKSRGVDGSDSGLLGFARQVADEVGPSDQVSMSDIMMFAKKVAANPSESGVITESSGVGFDFRELRRERHGTGSQDGFSVAESDVLAFARQVAQGAHSTAGTDASDIFAFARKAAQDTSMVGTDVSNSVLAFARQAARQSSQSGVTSEPSAVGSNVLSFARKVANLSEASSVAVSESDIFAFAREAAKNVSQSGVASTDGVRHNATSNASSLGTFDMVQFAHNVAQDVSQGGFSEATQEVSEGGSMNSDVLAYARAAAAAVPSSTGVQSSDIFVAARQRGASGTMLNPTEKEDTVSVLSGDLFAMAKKTADQVSHANSSVAGSSLPGGLNQLFHHAESASGADDDDDIFTAAQRAAEQVSRSGIQSAMSMGLSEGGIHDLLAPVKAAPEAGEVEEEPSPSEPSEMDLMAIAQGVARQVSRSNASSVSESPAKITKLFEAGEESETSDLFAIANKAAEETSQVSSRGGTRGRNQGMSDIFTSRPRAIVAPPQPEDLSDAGDLFAFAKVTAAEASRSGVTSASAASVQGNMKDLFAPPRRVAAKAQPKAKAMTSPEAPPEPEASDAGLSDLFASARKAAEQASRSGVHSDVPQGAITDLFASKIPRSQVNKPAVSGAPPRQPEASKRLDMPNTKEPSINSEQSDLLAVAQGAAQQEEASVVSQNSSDLLAAANKAAQQVSRSGVQSSAAGGLALHEVFAPKLPKAAAKPKAKQVDSQQANKAASPPSEDGSDLLAAAQGAAEQMSRSGVQSSVGRGTVPNIQQAVGKVPEAKKQVDEASEVGSDLLAAARGAAAGTSNSGVHSSIHGSGKVGATNLFGARRGEGNDWLAAAQSAAEEFSQSGVGTSHDGSASDILGAARLAAQDVSRSGVGDGSDLFAAARRAALDVSDAGTDATAAVLFAARGRGRDFEFSPPGRRLHPETRHGYARPISDVGDGSSPARPWAVPLVPAVARAPHVGPPDPPPLPNRTFLTDTMEEEGALEDEEEDGLFIPAKVFPGSPRSLEPSSPRLLAEHRPPPGVVPPPRRSADVPVIHQEQKARSPPPPPPRAEASPNNSGPSSPRSPVSPVSPRQTRQGVERQQMLTELRRRPGREDRDYKRKHCRVEASQSPKQGE